MKDKTKPLALIGSLALIFAAVAVFIGVSIIGIALEERKEEPAEADGFTINSYHVDLDVDEYYSIKVSEEIGVNFYEGYHHGIFRFVPEWLQYTNQKGKTMSRHAKISNLICHNVNYEVDKINKKQRIKMGSAFTTLDPGDYEYDISYTYDMGGDTYKDYDEFIFHVYGDFWGTRIKKPTLTIHLPKAIDENTEVKFFADKKRKNDISDYVEYKISGDTITAKVSYRYDLQKALTVDIVLPDGYFTSAKISYHSDSFKICLLCMLGGVVSYLLWRRYCSNPPEDVYKSKESLPPDNLDPAEMGYILTGTNGQKLGVAMIIQLACKGYIKIKSPSSKKGLTIIKNKDVNISNLTENESIIYYALFKNGDENCLSKDTSITKAYDKLYRNLSNTIGYKLHDFKAYACYAVSGTLTLVLWIAWIAAFCFIEDMHPSLWFLYWPALIGVFACVVFAIKDYRAGETLYSKQIRARIFGYKHYLEDIKKEKLSKDIEADEYINSALPYAYVLGISKSLIKRFNPVIDAENRYYDYLDNIGLATYSSSSSSSSRSSSSCGGGCSSCGGGCSSCGGGGSW